MNKTLLRASLIAMLGFVACGNDFMNVNAMEEVSTNVIFDPEAKNKQAVQRIVDKMREYIGSGMYDDAVKLMSNYVCAKGKSLEALFPSVLKDLELKTYFGDKANRHVEKLFRTLGYLSLGTCFNVINPNKLLAIATDDLDAYRATTRKMNYEFEPLAAMLAGSVKVFNFMVADSHPSDLFNAALVGGNSKLVSLCVQNKLHENWDFNCFRGVGFIKDDLFQWLIDQDKELDKGVATRFLLTASAGGRWNFVKFLVEQGADVRAMDEYRKTPLHYASGDGHLDVVKFLVGQNANVKAKDTWGQTPLHCASGNRHLNVVKFLVGQNANVKAGNKYGQTPIHYASNNGHLGLVQYLVEQNADIWAMDAFGRTPIHYASNNGHLGLVQYLVGQNADVNAKDTWGQTPLHCASGNGHLDVVKFLVESCKANVEAIDKDGYTPLHYASNNGHSEVFKYLHEKDANMKAEYKMDEAPLHYASVRGNLDVVKFLVGKKADVNAKDKNGQTPLHYASWKGHLDVVEYLVEQGANVNAENEGGWTPLIIALKKGHLEVFKYLYEKHPVKITDDVISKAGMGEIRKYLLDKKIEQDTREYLHEYLHKELGISIKAGNKDGWQYSWQYSWGIALEKGHLEMVKHIYENYPVKITDEAISKAGTDKIKEYLLDKKAEQAKQAK